MDAVAELRAFNRVYTRRLGMLGEGLHGTRHALPEARVLYELGQLEASEVRDLRTGLGMDAGFLSRVLGRLEASGLIERSASPTDTRAQVATLTDAGRTRFAELDASSVADNAALAETLGPTGVDALRTVRAALEPGELALRGPEPGDLGWMVERHGALYAAEHGWNWRSEVLAAKVLAAYEPPRDRIWIATVGGVRAGNVMCVEQDAWTARLRMLLVEPHARGLGLGATLVDACIAHARERAYDRIVLWTNDVLAAARRLYDRRGFRLEDEAEHDDFGPRLVGQTLSLEL
jgi:DNA-binding MarR family transcriptional regulator/GNAT superfamily N-acetyltransferase